VTAKLIRWLNAVFFEHRIRVKSRCYWLGLHKTTNTRKGTTKWYDGNPSTYRHWNKHGRNKPTTCVCYTARGFSYAKCNTRHYYTCEKRAGAGSSLLAFVSVVDVFFQLCYRWSTEYAAFLPRDTMLAWYTPSTCVDLCLSVTSRSSTKTAKHRIT